jgi:hypothetical protein
MSGQRPAANLRERFSAAVDAHRKGKIEVARRSYETLLALDPPDPLKADISINLGSILREADEFAQADRLLHQAVRLSPDNYSAYFNLANHLVHQQRYLEAEVAYMKAMALKPAEDLQFRLSIALLGQGRWDTGLPLYERRPDRVTTPLRTLSFPEWDGSPLNGRSVLVWREQGYGDELMMARFISQLKTNGAGRVTVAPTVALLRLFSTLDGVDEVFEAVGEVAIPAHDVWVLPFSMPYRLGVTPQTVAMPGYLRAPDEARAKWAGFVEPGRKTIGFVWHGNPVQRLERYRGLPSPHVLAPLAEHAALVDLQEPRGDFADTAAIVEQLDLVVTTDTAMAHLAGALGKRCWVILTHVGCDWRWGRETHASNWYPNTRLWRRRPDGDWSEVVAAMAAELAASPL